jgi:hypothetical protein
MNAGMSFSQRREDERKHDHRYRAWHHTSDCFYCGERAIDRDHVPPLTLADHYLQPERSKRIPFITVRACSDCNRRLGSRPLPTLIDRASYLARALEAAYEKVKGGWTEEAMAKAELSYTMRKFCKSRDKKWEVLLDRVRFVQRRCIDHEMLSPPLQEEVPHPV